jgi:YD repeat-containing protein
MGRFLSVDPQERRTATANPQEWNRYAYALNNPIKFVDPDGEETQLAYGQRTSHNSLGHLAIIINDRVYSYGTNYSRRDSTVQDWGADASQYLAAQAANRATQLLTLGIPTEQEAKLEAYLKSNNPNAKGAPGPALLTNNCATVCQGALVATGTLTSVVLDTSGVLQMSGGPAVTPLNVVNAATQAGLVTRIETVGQPTKAKWYESLWNSIREALR